MAVRIATKSSKLGPPLEVREWFLRKRGERDVRLPLLLGLLRGVVGKQRVSIIVVIVMVVVSLHPFCLL